MNIQLGPVLGVDAEYRYSICFLSTIKMKKTEVELNLTTSDDKETTKVKFESITKLASHYFYRFSFDIPEKEDAYSITYFIMGKGERMENRHKHKGRLQKWTFEVPGKKKMPKIGFSSCNGDSGAHPSTIHEKEFVMWKKMKQNHSQPDGKFHYLLMGGDQVYADSIWERVDFLTTLKLEAESIWDKLKNIGKNKALKKLTTNAVAAYKVSKSKGKIFQKELEHFYEQLYIDSWANKDMSFMLASVPSIMMWDDHDIFDGWGSHAAKVQKSDIFHHIFPVAQKYFELFQIRTKDNSSLISTKHYSMHITLRNVEVVVLDNRSFRTQNRIMTKTQYNDLNKVFDRPLFETIPTKLAKEKVLCLVIPVPVAHLDFSDLAETMLSSFKQNDFRHTLSDDAIDHWDHKKHKEEQKQLLDLIFTASEKHEVKYTCIVSGDVHSAGAATIENKEGQKITQLISSGMVHIPPTWTQDKVLSSTSKPVSEISGYSLMLKNYGTYKEQTINHRNFGFLSKGRGIVSSLAIEGEKELAFRTLNKFNKRKSKKKS